MCKSGLWWSTSGAVCGEITRGECATPNQCYCLMVYAAERSEVAHAGRTVYIVAADDVGYVEGDSIHVKRNLRFRGRVVAAVPLKGLTGILTVSLTQIRQIGPETSRSTGQGRVG